MRSRYKFNEFSDHLYFMTWTILGKQKIFLDSIYCEIIIDSFKFYKNKKELKIFFYVIMDHHIHITASHPKDIRSIIQNMKGFTAHEIINRLKSENKVEILKILKFLKKQYKTESTYQVWQEGSYPKVISSLKMLRQKIEYIHLNHVKRGFVKEPDDWYYSSARNFAGKTNPFEVDELEL